MLYFMGVLRCIGDFLEWCVGELAPPKTLKTLINQGFYYPHRPIFTPQFPVAKMVIFVKIGAKFVVWEVGS